MNELRKPWDKIQRTVSPALIQELVTDEERVLAMAQFPHAADNFLFTVLIHLNSGGYVVWTYNSETGGFSNGSYFFNGDDRDNHAKALLEFTRRVTETVNEWWLR